MKNPLTIGSIQASIFLAATFGSLHAAPYGPEGHPTRWTQPNGTVVELRMFGDESYARTETPDGYAVQLNEATKTYHYAAPSGNGASWVLTDVPADQAPPAGLKRHVDLAPARIREMGRENRAKNQPERAARWAEKVQAVSKLRSLRGNAGQLRSAEAAEIATKAAPVVGTLNGLTILVQFPDDPNLPGNFPVNFPSSKAAIEAYCNADTYTANGNSGSVYGYFRDQSQGKLSYKQTVTAVVTVPQPKDYYNYSNFPTNTAWRPDAGPTLLRDALEVLKTQNFNFSGLTTGPGNRILATNIFFAGADSGTWARGLWPSQSSLVVPVNVGSTGQPRYVSAYQITNIENNAPVIGTFCHENGHLILDYPDLYDYDYDSEGVGKHCLMGGGNYLNGGKTPCPINAYFKDIVGWANVTDVGVSEYKTVSMPTTGNRAWRVRKPGSTSEYFIVENRGAGDKWATHCVDKGIAIWHIDENVYGNDSQQRTLAEHYQVSLEQADGKFDLENLPRFGNDGDAGDLFDLAKPVFSPNTTPSSRWWDGTNSRLKIEVAGSLGANTQVVFGDLPPNTILVSSPNGGEILYAKSSSTIRWKSNIQGRVKIDLYKGDVFHSRIASNQESDGVYSWPVSAELPPAKDYKIRITALTNPVPTQDSSNGDFEISPATFPVGGVIPHGWFKPKGTSTAWKVVSGGAYEGNKALRTGKIGDGKRSAIAYKSNFLAGRVSFYVKVSTEKNYDTFKFYIDGVQQTFPGGVKSLSGSMSWRFVSFPVTAGTHTFMWAYDKDDSYGDLSDGVWLDAVATPPTTQEIAVEKPVGVDHKNGALTHSFPETTMGYSSSAQTFTIRNKGKADLHGIRFLKSGANGGDFQVRALTSTVVAPGKTATFQVVFAPGSMGPKTASIMVVSNDEDEEKFRINFKGVGLGVPKVTVTQAGKKLKDAGVAKRFGSVRIGAEGSTRLFTITNRGSVDLKGIKLRRTGKNAKDFTFGALGATTLAPGASTTFRVTFKPTGRFTRKAAIQIISNDRITGRFDIPVTGTGLARKAKTTTAAVAKSANTGGSIVEAVLGGSSTAALSGTTSTSLEVVGGKKYRSLTVSKKAGAVLAPVVEVSPNLLDWYSGTTHTTVLVDDATTLKVRDNTPVTPDTKRYIRVK